MAGIKGMIKITLLNLYYEVQSTFCALKLWHVKVIHLMLTHTLFTNKFSVNETYLIIIVYFSCTLGHFECSGLVSLAFAGSIGMTFVILACALPSYKTWWSFFVVLFYVLCPIPTMVARMYTDSTASSNSPCMETAVFITMGFIVSSFALPIVLARATTIAWGACYLTLAGNVIVFLTILGFFTIFDIDDSAYAMW